MKEILITLTVAVALTGISFILVTKIIDWQQEKLQLEMNWEVTKFEVEMKKACQGFAATTTDKKWGYKSCVKELKLNKEKLQML